MKIIFLKCIYENTQYCINDVYNYSLIIFDEKSLINMTQKMNEKSRKSSTFYMVHVDFLESCKLVIYNRNNYLRKGFRYLRYLEFAEEGTLCYN